MKDEPLINFEMFCKAMDIVEKISGQLHEEREKNRELQKMVAELTNFKNIVACCFELFSMDARMAKRIEVVDDEG